MPVIPSVIPVDLSGGVDTKTDPKRVAGKMLQVQNGIYTAPGQVRKRNGYTKIPTTIEGGGNLVAPYGLQSYNGELLCWDQGDLYGYSPTANAWVNRGHNQSVELSKQSVYTGFLPINNGTILQPTGFQDSLIFNGYTIHAWSLQGNTQTAVYTAVVDNTSGSFVLPPTQAIAPYNTGQYPNAPVRVVLIGGTVPGIVYGASVSGGTYPLQLVTLTIGGSSITVNAPVSLTGSYHSSPVGAYPSFDAIGTAAGATIAFTTGSGFIIANINSVGGIVTDVVVTDTSLDGPIMLRQNPNNSNISLYYTHATFVTGNRTAGSIVWRVYSSSLSVVLGATTAVTLSAPYFVTNMAAVQTDVTTQTVYYGTMAITLSGGPPYPAADLLDQTNNVAVTEAGVTTGGAVFAYGVVPFSNIATVTANSYTSNYIVLAYRPYILTSGSGFPGATLFLVDLADTHVVARFNNGTASCSALTQTNSSYSNTLYIGGTPTLQVSGSTVSLPAASAIQSELWLNTIFTVSGVFNYSMNFASPNTYMSVKAGSDLIINGANPALYDGRRVTEWGFHVPPVIIGYNVALGSGSIGPGTYSYVAVFQWTDANGDLHQSEYSDAVSVVVGSGSTNTITLTVTPCYLTGKTNPVLILGRTTNGGTVYFNTLQITTVTPSNQSTITVSISDALPDSQLTALPPVYAYPGSQTLFNTSPPAFIAMAGHNNRLWMVDSENPNTIVGTKTYQPAVGLSPTELLQVQVDPKFGNITALAEMDGNLIGWKNFNVFAIAGDLPGDTGQNGTIQAAQFIPSAVGTMVPKSIILTPKGLLFQSAAGLYLMDRSLGIHYADSFFDGAMVEAFNSQTYTAANIIPSTSQIRILAASGSSLVYDYIFDKWASFTNHAGLASCIWNGTYVYLRSDHAIYQENTSSYLDNATAFGLSVQTSWLVLSSVQNFQRVKILELLGDYTGGGGHGIQVSLAYDFSSTFATPVPYSFQSTSGPFQYRQFPAQQKCDSISLLIQEITTGASGEYIGLSELSLEAGLKKGVNKLSAGSSVG